MQTHRELLAHRSFRVPHQSFNSDMILVFKDILFSIVRKNCFSSTTLASSLFFNGLNLKLFTVVPNYLKKIRHESGQIYSE